MGGKARPAHTPLRADSQTTRTVAFLRGMTLGNRRITNQELKEHFETMGFSNVEVFLASGNVIFEHQAGPADLESYIATELSKLLHYQVPTFVRSSQEVRDIANREPFSPAQTGHLHGKLQIMLCARLPSPQQKRAALAAATHKDHLAIYHREVYWLPAGGISQSELDLKTITRALGPVTIRTRNTMQRISSKYLS